MLNFRYYNPTEIIFGRDTHKAVGQQVKRFADKVLLHYGGGSVRKTGVLDAVMASLTTAGITFVELGGVQPNPRLSLVEEGVRICREEGLSFILAVGGGSVIDSAKAIAMGACYDGDVWDFYRHGVKPESALGVGVVLTIPAAGSESSDGSVITKEDEQLKLSSISDLQYPRFAVLNPALCYTLPPSQLAAGGADMLAHVMERYFSTEPHTDISDRLCEGTLRSLMLSLPRAMDNMQDYDTWAEIMWAGTIAHNGMIGKGRREEWTCHGIEHELSAQYDIAHGAGLAIVFPAWMKYVHKAAMPRFVQFAQRVMDVDIAADEPEAIVLEGIARLEAFLAKIGAPTRLSQAGIGTDRFELMARHFCGDGTRGSIMPLAAADVVRIFELAQ